MNRKIILVGSFASLFLITNCGGSSTDANSEIEKEKLKLKQAELEGSAKAIINETVEIKGSYFPFVGKKLVTVSAQVIEFTE